MKTIRTTFAAALTVAVLAGSAMFATTNISQAGGYYGGYYNHHYTPVHCYYKKVKVWTHYGWRWKRIKVCH